MAIWLTVSDEAELEAAFRQVAERFGGLDIVCNNAGISQSTPLDDYTPEEFDKIIDINVRACSTAARRRRACSARAASSSTRAPW